MIDLTAQLDTNEINRKMREVYANAKQMTSGVVTESEKMDLAMMRFKNTLISTAAQIGGGIGLFQLARQIATTRGEFQQLEVAFTTLLQSKSKADALMAEAVELAAKTPFSLQDVATGARQLIAYGFAAEDITDTLTRLGNVASGLGLPMERLTYLFGTTMTQGRLYARDLIQFTTSGIPLLQELADMYGVNTDEVNKMVTAGKVGFEDVRRVFENMTNSGGKFYNLMQEQSKTINGQISNLGDAISVMFNEIGKSQEGVINSAISGAAYLVENYDKVLKILVPLVAAYGMYKASLIAVAAAQSAVTGVQYAAEIAELTKLLPIKEANKNADIEAAVASGRLTQGKAAQLIAIRAEIAAKLESLKATATQAALEQANAAIGLKNARLNAFNAKQAFQQARVNLSLAKLGGDATQIEAANEALLAAEKNSGTAANLKNTASKELGIAKSKASVAATAAETMQTNINTAAITAAARAKGLLAAASIIAKNAIRTLGASLASFLPTAIIAAVGMLAYKLYEVATAETEAEKAAKRLREANKDFETSVLKETSVLNIMFDRLKRAKEGTKEYADAKKAIQDKYGPLLSSMGQEVRSLNNITGAQKALTAAILDTARARAQERFVQEAADTASQAQADALEKIKDKLIKEKGEGRGNELFENIKAALYEYNLDPQDREGKKYGEFVKTLRDSGITSGIGYGKEFTDAYFKYVSAVLQLKKAEADAQSLFGVPKKEDNNADQKPPTITEDLKTATKDYNDAVAAWDKGVKDNLETSVISKLKQDAEEAKKRLEDIQSALGVDPKAAAKAGADALKAQDDIDDARLKNLLAAQKGRIDVMDDGKDKELAQIDAERIAKLAAIDQEERDLKDKYQKLGKNSERYKVGEQMVKEFGSGDVDLLARPLIESAELVKKGWEDAGDGIATVFSSQYGVFDKQGKQHELLVTPILPNGDVLSKEELEDYLYNALEGADNILQADKKGIVISMDVSEDGSAGEKLHELQAQYYADALDFADRRTTASVNAVSQTAEVEKKYAKEIEDLYTQIGSVWLTKEEKKRAEIKKTYDGLRERESDRLKGGSITQDQYDTNISFINLTEEQEKIKNLLDQYKSYTQQREEIEKKFNDDIAEMEKQRTPDNSAQIDASIKTAKDKKTEAIKSVNDEEVALMQKSSGLLVQLFEDASNKSVSEVLKITKTCEDLMSYLSNTKTEDITPQFGFTAAQLKSLKGSPKDLEAIGSAIETLNTKVVQKNPFATLIKNLKDVFSAGENDDTTAKKLAKLGESASESANMIGNLAGELSDMFSAMGNEELAGAMNTVQGVMSAVSNIGEGFAKGGLIGGIGAAIGEIAKGISALFKAGDRRKEKEIQRIQEQVDALQKSYDALGSSIEKAYSTDAKGLIEDQNKMLEQQNVLIQNQIEKERSKKDSDKGKIKEWQSQIEENNKLIAENREKAIDAIFGEDLKSAIENFATAYADAWAKGEDKAESAKDTVRKMMRQMVTESIKAAIQASGAMEKIRKKLEEFYADKVLTGWEQDYIYDMAEDLQKQLDQQFGWADSLMKDEKGKDKLQGTSRGYETMSQEEGGELNGRFSDMQAKIMLLAEITARMEASGFRREQALLSCRDILIQMNGNVADIRAFTKVLPAMGDTLVSMNKKLDRL